MNLSATRVDSYLTCPRKFRYHYVDELPETFTGALAFGQAIHKTLHEMNLSASEHGVHPPPQFAAALFDYFWNETLKNDAPVFSSSGDEPTYRALSAKVLSAYYKTQTALAPPLVVEFSFALPWVDDGGEEHLLRGIIDRVDEGPNGLAVTDYKSGKSKPKADGIGDNLQLLLYAHAATQLLGEPVERVTILHLRDGTPLSAPPNPEATRRIFSETLPFVVNGIASGEFPPRYGFWCNWCDHKARCQAAGPDELEMEALEAALAATR